MTERNREASLQAREFFAQISLFCAALESWSMLKDALDNSDEKDICLSTWSKSVFDVRSDFAEQLRRMTRASPSTGSFLALTWRCKSRRGHGPSNSSRQFDVGNCRNVGDLDLSCQRQLWWSRDGAEEEIELRKEAELSWEEKRLRGWVEKKKLSWDELRRWVEKRLIDWVDKLRRDWSIEPRRRDLVLRWGVGFEALDFASWPNDLDSSYISNNVGSMLLKLVEAALMPLVEMDEPRNEANLKLEPSNLPWTYHIKLSSFCWIQWPRLIPVDILRSLRISSSCLRVLSPKHTSSQISIIDWHNTPWQWDPIQR